MQFLVRPITLIEEEEKAHHWNIMFDEFEPCREPTPEAENKGLADVDHDSKATPSSKAKRKAKTGH